MPKDGWVETLNLFISSEEHMELLFLGWKFISGI
jgi:hypothetical protein